jgi:hypothetical protein
MRVSRRYSLEGTRFATATEERDSLYYQSGSYLNTAQNENWIVITGGVHYEAAEKLEDRILVLLHTVQRH